MDFDFNIDLNNAIEGLVGQVEDVCQQEDFRLEVHNIFAKLIDPWVPFLEGPLSQSGLANVTPEYVRYGGSDVGVPYAHYQYNGIDFNHTTEFHPLASAKWDKVAMQSQLPNFEISVHESLKKRLQKSQ